MQPNVRPRPGRSALRSCVPRQRRMRQGMRRAVPSELHRQIRAENERVRPGHLWRARARAAARRCGLLRGRYDVYGTAIGKARVFWCESHDGRRKSKRPAAVAAGQAGATKKPTRVAAAARTRDSGSDDSSDSDTTNPYAFRGGPSGDGRVADD